MSVTISAAVASAAASQMRLVRALTDPGVHRSLCRDVRVIETHISYVLLTGLTAYKIKKAVDLGFLDFTTLAARHYYCQREVELNRRLAPGIYRDVVAITGTPDAPAIGGAGAAIEYAVRMREFPQASLLTQVLTRGALTAAHIDGLATVVARFHASAKRAGREARFGAADSMLELARENFSEIDPLLERDDDRRLVAGLRGWTMREHALRAARLAQRQASGFVRECHGDLHLGNIALVDGAITIFDCIEFNEAMRWTDVMADVAFVVMDLQDRRRPDFASRFLNAYLEATGDYAGVEVLRFYVVYRAMVRAKVAALRGRQTGDVDGHARAMAECCDYLALAQRCAAATSAAITITHGPSGSGKTTESQALVETLGAIRVRTDVERKRLHGLAPLTATGSAVGAGMYSAAETGRTYARVARLARAIADSGYPVIVDGAFLLRAQRDRFRRLAADLNLPFVIVDFVAPVDDLRRRVEQRRAAAADASEADIHVLEHQLATAEPLSPDERRLAVTVESNGPEPRSWPLDVLARLEDQRRTVNTGHVAPRTT